MATTSEYWRWSAVETVACLKKGEVAPSEILRSIASRVEAVDRQVNALPTLCLERAEAAARRLEATPLEARGLLAGLPVPVKDSFEVAGVRTTWGSPAFADFVPSYSNYLVEALEAAGGVVYAKSNTPEFEAGANTFNEVFGKTRNPWNLGRSASGSSGGAAVAVTTGMAHMAQGSDFACSLRYPAAFCNVVGLRPSPGLVPQGPSDFPYQTLAVAGPIGRDVADTALCLDALVRFDERDPLSNPRPAGAYVDTACAPRRPRRVGFSLDLGLAVVARDVSSVFRHAIEKIARAGIPVEEARPDLSAAHDAFRPLRAFQFAALRGALLETDRARIKPEVVWNIEQGQKVAAADLMRAERLRARARDNLLAFLNKYDLLLTPTAPVAPFSIEERYVTEIEGVKLETYLDWMVLGYAISVTGCPAISIPCGLTAEGLPVGLQLVGRPYGEAALLAMAAYIEGVLECRLAAPIDPHGMA